ncbi:unnamed protein product [Owenia fusiformis]|uniref:Peptidase S1 domain-containing protein n=1 Tax=Owenia fusiformis TaxID=6347 RepID=A0A8S4NN55_OWEFU|nr:unnamed protein product [Owenia fusiformis]
MIATKHLMQWLLIALGLCITLTQGAKCKKSGVNPKTCKTINDCTNGYKCTKSKCCRMSKLCPAGDPMQGSQKGEFPTCVNDSDCKEGYQCNINEGKQYSVCCEKIEGSCEIPENGKVIAVGKTIKIGKCKKCDCTADGLECKSIRSKKCPCEYEGKEYKSGDLYTNATHTCSVLCSAKKTKLAKCKGVCTIETDDGEEILPIGKTWESPDKCRTCKCKTQGVDCKLKNTGELQNKTHICTVMCAQKTMECEEKVDGPHWTQWGPWSMCDELECGRKVRIRKCKGQNGDNLNSSHCKGEEREVAWCPLPDDVPWPQWTVWGHWSKCHAYECGPMRRARMCIEKTGEVLETSKCEGEEEEQQWCPPCLGRSAGGFRVLRSERHLFSGVVSLSKKEAQDTEPKHFCGGNIVTNSWILTAAHCICKIKGCCSPDNKVSCDIQRIVRVTAGRLKLTRHDKVEQIKNISKAYVIHNYIPDIDGANMRNDIALIRLADHLEFGDGFVEPGTLPTGMCANDQENVTICETVWDKAVNQECKMAGWGATPKTEPDPSPDMRQLEMTVRTYIPQEGVTKIKGVGGTPCPGDSGSPLMCGGDAEKPGPTIGLMSYVEMMGCYTGNPSATVATSVPDYLDWVTEHVVDRTEWGEWSCCSSQCGRNCSKPCLKGKMQRIRGCVGPVFGGQEPRKECFQKETKECHTQYQCQGSQWGTWGGFSPCTMLCGKQVKIRGRQCLRPDGTIDPDLNNCEPDEDTGVSNIENQNCMPEITQKVDPPCEHPKANGGNEPKQWLAAFYHNGVLKCAGTLLSKRWVVVAASCLIATADDCPTEVGWDVRFGKQSIGKNDEIETRKISRIIFHPDFRALDAAKKIFANNKAMVQLETAVGLKAACVKPMSKNLKSPCSAPQFQN